MYQTPTPSQNSCHFLLFLARLEKTIELQRQNLCEIPAFEPYCAFRFIDPGCKNFINTNDLQLFLQKFSYFFDPKLIFSGFISRYDADHDGVLNYAEYFYLIFQSF